MARSEMQRLTGRTPDPRPEVLQLVAAARASLEFDYEADAKAGSTGQLSEPLKMLDWETEF